MSNNDEICLPERLSSRQKFIVTLVLISVMWGYIISLSIGYNKLVDLSNRLTVELNDCKNPEQPGVGPIVSNNATSFPILNNFEAAQDV